MYLADLGKSLGTKYSAFRTKYFNTISMRYGTDKVFNTYELKQGADKLIQKAVKQSAIALDTIGLIEMPEMNMRDIAVSMSSSEQMQYNSMEKELFATLNNKKEFAFSAGSAYWKCHQLANGALYTDEIPKKNRAFAVLHDHKIEALKNLIEELNGKPLLVGYQYDHDLRRIKEAVPEAESFDKKSISRWNAFEIPVLLLQYQQAAYGLNLQHGGNDLALFSLTDNWANYDQLICRIYRQGAGKQVFVHRIITKNTIDEVISLRLDRKQMGNTGLIDALKAYRFKKDQLGY